MDLDKLTLGDIKSLKNLLTNQSNSTSLNSQLGEKVIIRTYSAGVWFGELKEKSGMEVMLHNARRMYRFWCAKSISLSGVAQYGLNQEKSKICPAVNKVCLESIEIISCTDIAIKSIEGAKDVEAE
tara:strand:+ start:273 stop:650 length:378 start_codon:yes stop_codon:yes gene_type:complete